MQGSVLAMNSRRSLMFWTVIAIACALVFWRGSLALRRAALELRYFWWLAVILGGGLWLLLTVGRNPK